MTETTQSASLNNLISKKAQTLRENHGAAGGIPGPDDLDTVTIGGHQRIMGTDARWMSVALAEVLTLRIDMHGAERKLLIGPEEKPYLFGTGDVDVGWLPWLEFEHTWESAIHQLESFIDFVESEGEEVEGKPRYERLRASFDSFS